MREPVKLQVKPFIKFANEETISILRELLREAEAGEVQEIHAISVLVAGNIRLHYTPSEDVVRQVGHLEILRASVMQRVLG